MISLPVFFSNLLIALQCRSVAGCVIECGVWCGGMSAGFAEALGRHRHYYLFDSFAGMPPAKDLDGPLAKAWQSNKNAPFNFNNLRVDMQVAKTVMQKTGAQNVHFVKGWFEDTLTGFTPKEPIALLHLDADWYDSIL